MLRLFLVSLLFISFLIFNQKVVNVSFGDNNPTESSDSKDEPNDFFYYQRSYPNKTFAVNAYKSAMDVAASPISERGLDNISTTSWKLQGPGNIGARVNDIAIHPKNNQIAYIGFSCGGIFKTQDGGKNWKPIFDENSYLSIGDITLDPQHPDTLYVGTGDPNISSNPFVGNGIFRSNDGGNTWESLGLSNVGIISKIAINPQNTNIIYVATMGSPFVRDSNRGLYKSADGGKTWTNVLFLSNQAGIIDMVMNPLDPNIIYVAGWDRIRTNFESTTFGPNCKILKTVNGGATWETLDTGLPTTNISRIGLTIDPTNPKILYTILIDTNFNLGGVYKTVNNGTSWFPIPTGEVNGLPSDLMGSPGFGWYFGKIVLNPNNTKEVYILGVESYYTNNDGQFWNNTAPNTIETSIHVDNHALEFDNLGNKYLGTDGGAYFCSNLTGTWSDFENIPTTQFYKTAYNPFKPNNYYGGAQDNGTIGGNSSNINNWEKLFDGDGFQTIFHPRDSNRYYVEVQYGGIFTTFNGNDVNKVFSQKISNGLDATSKRGWFMPYILSNHNDEKLFCGTYLVYKLNYLKNSNPFFQTNTWQAISPDLTDKNPGNEERFHYITAIDESKQDSNLIIAGTSDANFWRTKDGGKNWVQLFGLPNQYITSIKISEQDKSKFFVTLSGYKDNSNLPHIYYSKTAGDQWINISGNLPSLAINDLEILPNTNDSSIVVATDGGVYLTQNLGTSWKKLGTGMPIIPVFDLSFNVNNREIVAGTFARSIYSFPVDSIEKTDIHLVEINGNISTDNGTKLLNTNIVLEKFDTTATNTNGEFTISSIPASLKSILFPYKDDSIYNGISTADMIIIRKHILQIEMMTSPYKYIAADANNDRKVSTADLVLLNKIILRIDSTFSKNKIWRFVPANYVFKNTDNPLLDTIPEFLSINDFNKTANLNFIGIKTGDVNNSVKLNFASDFVDRSIAPLSIENFTFKKGENIRIPIYFKDIENINGFQFGFKFENLAFKSIVPVSLEIEKSNYNVVDNQLIINWFDDIESNDNPLFFIEYEAINNSTLKQSFALSSQYFFPELYTANSTENIQIQWIEKVDNIGNLFPNPCTNNLFIPINSKENRIAQIELLTLDGRLITAKSNHIAIGNSTLNLSDILPTLTSGVYLLVIDKKTIRKFVKL